MCSVVYLFVCECVFDNTIKKIGELSFIFAKMKKKQSVYFLI